MPNIKVKERTTIKTSEQMAKNTVKSRQDRYYLYGKRRKYE